MGLPARFVGAWERRDLHLDGCPVRDAGRAVWIEAGDAFVDVRGPGGFASDTSFGGVTEWDPPFLTWTHAFGRHHEGGLDRGHIEFDGDDLIESGDFIAGAPHAYCERWCRFDGDREPVLVARHRDGLAVRVGAHAAAIVDARASGGGFAARYQRFVGGSWCTEIEIDDGAVDMLPLLPDLARRADWELVQ